MRWRYMLLVFAVITTALLIWRWSERHKPIQDVIHGGSPAATEGFDQ